MTVDDNVHPLALHGPGRLASLHVQAITVACPRPPKGCGQAAGDRCVNLSALRDAGVAPPDMSAPPPVPAETPGETPSALLRRAAAKVRELSDGATPGPWAAVDEEFVGPGYNPSVLGNGGEWVAEAGPKRHVIQAPNGYGDQDAAWIATLGPQVAEPLAAWLNAEAGHAFCDASLLHSHRNRYFPHEVVTDADLWEQAERKQGHALALARVLLGSPVPVPDGEGTT